MGTTTLIGTLGAHMPYGFAPDHDFIGGSTGSAQKYNPPQSVPIPQPPAPIDYTFNLGLGGNYLPYTNSISGTVEDRLVTISFDYNYDTMVESLNIGWTPVSAHGTLPAGQSFAEFGGFEKAQYKKDPNKDFPRQTQFTAGSDDMTAPYAFVHRLRVQSRGGSSYKNGFQPYIRRLADVQTQRDRVPVYATETATGVDKKGKPYSGFQHFANNDYQPLVDTGFPDDPPDDGQEDAGDDGGDDQDQSSRNFSDNVDQKYISFQYYYSYASPAMVYPGDVKQLDPLQVLFANGLKMTLTDEIPTEGLIKYATAYMNDPLREFSDAYEGATGLKPVAKNWLPPHEQCYEIARGQIFVEVDITLTIGQVKYNGQDANNHATFIYVNNIGPFDIIFSVEQIKLNLLTGEANLSYLSLTARIPVPTETTGARDYYGVDTRRFQVTSPVVDIPVPEDNTAVFIRFLKVSSPTRLANLNASPITTNVSVS